MKTSAAVIGLVLALVASAALAWDEPDSFRGVPWGASVAQTDEILSAATESSTRPSEKPDCWRGKGPCLLRAKVGPVMTTLQFHFHENRFVWAAVSFSPTDFAALKVIFQDRYGQPTARDEHEVQTRVGAKYVNEVLRWEGENIHIRLSKYGSKIDSGSAILTTAEHRKRQRDETTKSLQKGKGDL